MTVHSVDDSMTTPIPPLDFPTLTAVRLRNVAEANDVVTAAKKARIEAGISAAHHRLQCAVDAACDAGAGWTQIGDALGMRRGNAYQRFRKRATALRC